MFMICMKSVGFWPSIHLLYGWLHRNFIHIRHYICICSTVPGCIFITIKHHQCVLRQQKATKAKHFLITDSACFRYVLHSTSRAPIPAIHPLLFSCLLSHQMSLLLLQCWLSRARCFWTWLFHYIAFTNWPHNTCTYTYKLLVCFLTTSLCWWNRIPSLPSPAHDTHATCICRNATHECVYYAKWLQTARRTYTKYQTEYKMWLKLVCSGDDVASTNAKRINYSTIQLAPTPNALLERTFTVFEEFAIAFMCVLQPVFWCVYVSFMKPEISIGNKKKCFKFPLEFEWV